MASEPNAPWYARHPMPKSATIDQRANDALLNTPFFIDLASSMKRLLTDDPLKTMESLNEMAKKMTDVHEVISAMLKQQAAQAIER